MPSALKPIGRTARDRLTHWMPAEATLTAADARSGRLAAARRAKAEPFRVAPQPRPSSTKNWMPRLRRSDDIERYAAANRATGIPE